MDRPDYTRSDTIFWEIRSRRPDTVFYDPCATVLTRDRGGREGFESARRPQANCGSGVTLEEILAGVVPVPPGQSVQGRIVIGDFVPQGRYRINLWLLDGTGEPISPEPNHTPPFQIFPFTN